MSTRSRKLVRTWTLTINLASCAYPIWNRCHQNPLTVGAVWVVVRIILRCDHSTVARYGNGSRRVNTGHLSEKGCVTYLKQDQLSFRHWVKLNEWWGTNVHRERVLRRSGFFPFPAGHHDIHNIQWLLPRSRLDSKLNISHGTVTW